MHHDSEDSAEYQSPEEIADYQRPKSSDYQPPDTHYQTPRNADRPKSCVGPINNQPWFHGNISRIDAEMLIESDGQFLVRESSSSKGQYVLSGMKGSQHCHLLLVDPEGQVIILSSMQEWHQNGAEGAEGAVALHQGVSEGAVALHWGVSALLIREFLTKNCVLMLRKIPSIWLYSSPDG